MRYGFYLPTRGALANPTDLGALLSKAEALGLDSVMIADHVVFPVTIESEYPYTVTGAFPSTTGEALEQLSLTAFVAARTSTLRLVTSVMILPYRNPVLTAKTLATIDVLSAGRLTVGVGVGWLEEEFEALDAAPFAKRGAVSDEYIDVFKKLWAGGVAEHEGEFYRFAPLRCLPLPVQQPHPPIWIGGHSRPAMRRVARLGDGWHPVGATAAVPLLPDEFAGKLDELRRMTDAEGRDFSKIDVSFKAPIYDEGKPHDGADRKLFTGSAEQIAADVRTYERLGVSELVLDFRGDSLSGALDRMESFMSRVAAIV